MNNIDILCEERIKNMLSASASGVTIECRDEVTSTNTVLKADTSGDERALISLSQSAGRGRLGRSFFSPHDTGLYLSLRINASTLSPKNLMLLTPAAAVAVCRAVEAIGEKTLQIKWVNDLILDGRKVCGILTETVTFPNGTTSVIVGVGINMYAPDGGFPDELTDIAGYIFEQRRENLRNEIVAAFISSFMELVGDIENAEFVDEYRKRSCVIGRNINVFRSGLDIIRTAYAVDIDDECRLIVRYDDGTEDALYSGEISIRTL